MEVEHGEENVQVKPHAYVICTQMSGSHLSEGLWCG